MMSGSIVLQRLCFCKLEFHATPSKQFNLCSWEKKGSLAYWKPTEEGVSQSSECIEVMERASVSSDTFFNAFYVGHWRKLTLLRSLDLNLRFSGRFLLETFCHTGLGETQALASIELASTAESEFEIALPWERQQAAMRFSFRLTSLKDGAQLLGGDWRTRDRPGQTVRLVVCITTYNQQEFAKRLIAKLLSDPALHNEDVRIQVVDQSDVAMLDDLNGGRCRIKRQKNLGSSGGFSRAIHECLYAAEGGKPTHLLLMDDDVEIETDSILRAIRMAQFAQKPFILAGTELDIFNPTNVYSVGEIVQKDASSNYDSFYALKNNLRYIDASLPNGMNAISIPHLTDFGGWWFCMIPVEAIMKIGLPLQFFLKWDDVEYGLRAKSRGFLSHTVAGIGLWHPPPQSKSAAWIRYMDFYSHLMYNSLCSYPEVLNLFEMEATWALIEVTKHKYRNAAAMIRALEDFIGGWDFYKNRTFPEYIMDLRKELASYEVNETSVPSIMPEQSRALKDRLSAVIEQFKLNGKDAQVGLKANLPATTSAKAWKHYFAHGNHSCFCDNADPI